MMAQLLVACSLSLLQYLGEGSHQFAYYERLSLDFIKLIRSEIIYLHAEITGKLSQILFGNYHFLIFLQYLSRIFRQWVDIREVS